MSDPENSCSQPSAAPGATSVPVPPSDLVVVPGWEQVFRVDVGGTIAFVALHAVLAGHAFGGIRIRDYAAEADALEDAKRLSQGMSRKVVLAGIDGGGGKSVILVPDDASGWDRAASVRALGAFVQSLGGRYHCGPDYGFTEADDSELRKTTEYVACAGLGDATARGVEAALRAVCPEPTRVAIQGLGAVGGPLAESLISAGVEVTAAEPRLADGSARSGSAGRIVPPEEIYDVEADVFAPCAAGGVLDAATIPRLRCGLVCGAANSPFAAAGDADLLHARGIDYVPDVIANAGAAAVGASRALGQGEHADERIAGIGSMAREIVARARAEGRSPHHVAVELADARIAALR